MKVLLLGSGGREHAFAWKLTQSPLLTKLWVAPGNAGTAQLAQNLPFAAEDIASVVDFCENHQPDLVVVGPEAPLVAGIVDAFRANPQLKDTPIIGPSKQGAMLEGSKDFSKQFMLRHGVPTAQAATFGKGNLEAGLAFLETVRPPYVLKADGLAAGKGVIITGDLQEAKATLREMLDGKFGEASARVLVEEFLSGIELSVFVLTDGNSYVLLPAAKDYKRIGEGDTGPNTGGMGAVSPVPFADAQFLEKVERQVVIPTVEGLKKENIDYKGFIFIGLMNQGGEPFVIEYNARMGDPETEVVFPRIKSDLLELLNLVAQGRLHEAQLDIDPRTATTVMLVAGGYPGDYEKGKPMKGFGQVGEAITFHAGTKLGAEGSILTNGGRVIALTGLGNSIPEALAVSYQAAQAIDFEGKYYRKDIGQDLL